MKNIQEKIEKYKEVKEIKKTVNMPETKFSVGPIIATVWKNEVTQNKEQKEYLTVSFERVYLDKESNSWKTTNTLRTGDLPKACLVLNKAFEYISFKGKQTADAEE